MTYSSKTTCPDRVLPSTLHTSHCTLHSSHSKFQTSHSTLHTSHSTLLTSHCFLHTPNLTLHTSHFTLRSSHSKLKLHTTHFTLHTPHFTLLTSHCFLHTSHFPTALFTPHTSHCSKTYVQQKNTSAKMEKNLLTNLFRSLHAATPITIYEVQLQKTIYYKCSHSTKQPWHSHYNAICRDWVAKHTRTTRNGVGNCSSKTGSRRQSRQKLIFEAFFIKNLNRKWKQPKSERIQLQQVHAAITMRLATIPGKTQWYYVLSSSTEAFETF